MATYINKEQARFEAKRYFKNMSEVQEDLDMLFCMLPAEDVAPVRHGRWKLLVSGNGVCSACHFTTVHVWDFDSSLSYCPHCGAKMDGDG